MRCLYLLALVVATAGCDVRDGDDSASPSRESHVVASSNGADPDRAEDGGWSQLPEAPAPARDAVVVAGRGQLFYWGRRVGSGSDQAAGVYDTATQRWRPVASAPIAPRRRPAAVWTGKDFLIWGPSDGAAYDPASDEWRILPRAPLSARRPALSVWTGSEMLVWGDASRTSRARDGVAYQPRTDRWRELPIAPLALNEASVAGRIGGISPSADPVCRNAVPLTDGLMRRAREQPLCFGGARIGGRHGDLFLVPPFPTGGMIGNHLVFRWEQNGERYALSLHAWEPLTETAATLAAIAAAGTD